MKTFKRICLHDTELRAENGDCQQLKRGEEYLTSDVRADGTVIVFSTYWAPFPVTAFAAAPTTSKEVEKLACDVEEWGKPVNPHEVAALIRQQALEIARLQQWQRDMVAKAADQSLDGYRELGSKCAALEERAERAEQERDALRADAERYRWLRDECKWADVVAEFGWQSQDVGLDTAIDAARQAAGDKG